LDKLLLAVLKGEVNKNLSQKSTFFVQGTGGQIQVDWIEIIKFFKINNKKKNKIIIIEIDIIPHMSRQKLS